MMPVTGKMIQKQLVQDIARSVQVPKNVTSLMVYSDCFNLIHAIGQMDTFCLWNQNIQVFLFVKSRPLYRRMRRFCMEKHNPRKSDDTTLRFKRLAKLVSLR